MSDFTSFLKQSALPVENKKVVVSERFIDPKTKKPIPWEIKAVSSDLDEQLRKECTRKVPVVGKKGQHTMETDTDKYIKKLCVACTVYPNLNDAALQDSYGVKGAEDLLTVMLVSGEFNDYKLKVIEHNKFDNDLEELVDEAKN